MEARDALTILLRAHADRATNSAAEKRLDEVFAGAALRVRLGRNVTRFEPAADGLDRAFGRLVAAIALARLAGRWWRLKACAGEGCARAFYDFSRNGKGRWCSMKRCGNPVKAQTFRRRNPERKGAARWFQNR